MIALWLWSCGRDPAPGPAPATPPEPTSSTSAPEPTLPIVEVTGTLSADATWSPDDAAWYHVTGELVVPAGVTLLVRAGTEVRFGGEAEITVHGTLRATGTESAHVRFVRDPDAPAVPDFHPSLPEGPPHWWGVHYEDSAATDNTLAWVDLDGAQSMQGSVGIVRSEAVLEHLVLSGTRLRSVYSDSASVTVRDSVFPTMFAPEDSAEELGLNNMAEYVKGEGAIPAGGHYRIERNVFGVPKGHNDVIDVAGNTWPAEVVEIRGNVFQGGGDDAIDGGGDMLLDGNLFQAIVKDADNLGSGDANCLSTADVSTTVAVITRNVYVGVDRAANFKRESFGWFEHNTVVGISPARESLPGDEPPRVLPSSAIRLVIPDPLHPDTAPPRHPAGVGASLDGNVFVDVPEVILGNPDENGSLGPWTSWLAVSRTLVPSAAVFANADGLAGRQFDYLVGAPVFTDAASGDWSLAPGSPGAGAGFGGRDLGAVVPYGAVVCCASGAVGPSVDLEVGGPGLFSFRWRLDGGDWTADVPITDPRAYLAQDSVARTAPLSLVGLAPGAHLLEVEGKDFAGVAEPVTAVTLTVR